MSYKSLLYCPDEKAARVVTQVLSELEFTVELSNEPFAAVKTLTDEHFDALVVDCQNEQNAGLLFKAARNSSLNHSSLSVAVVEGQAGVAKAFRIGANLVLTKPVNLEQSKSTLRVARGLLRKNETKVGATPSAPSVSAQAVGGFPTPATRPRAREAAASSAMSAAIQPAIPSAPQPRVPYSGLEVDPEPTPAPEPSEVALLESMPVNGKPAVAESTWAPRAQAAAEPIAASTAGQATGVAPALAKAREMRLSGTSPMITHEPIIQESSLDEPLPELSVPTFAVLEAAHSSSGGGKFIKIVLVVVLLGVAGYWGWQRFQPLQYLHGSAPAATPAQTAVPAEPAPTPAAPAAQSPAEPQNVPSGTAPATATTDASANQPGPTASASQPASTGPETIRVQELAMSSEPKGNAPKRQPIVIQVNAGSHSALKAPSQSQPTPPALTLNSSGTDAALNRIVTTDAAKPSPGAIRVSQGVSQGLVLKRVSPVYSQTALQLRKEGVVDLMATIDKSGAVTGVRVLSGDLMLANSAVEAVKQWKYRPYLLNGEPVEIQTQITVNFKLPR
jgi:TonB family protein